MNIADVRDVTPDASDPFAPVPSSCDLENWVMDSGCTSHMTPHLSDFEPDSFIEVTKVIEVADGHELECKRSGTVMMRFNNDEGELICLKIKYAHSLNYSFFSAKT